MIAACVPAHLVGKPVDDLRIPGEIRVALIVRMGKGHAAGLRARSSKRTTRSTRSCTRRAVEKFQKMMGWKS